MSTLLTPGSTPLIRAVGVTIDDQCFGFGSRIVLCFFFHRNLNPLLFDLFFSTFIVYNSKKLGEPENFQRKVISLFTSRFDQREVVERGPGARRFIRFTLSGV